MMLLGFGRRGGHLSLFFYGLLIWGLCFVVGRRVQGFDLTFPNLALTRPDIDYKGAESVCN
jgi:hypothetical protein